MKRLLTLAGLLLVAFLIGCAQLGVPQPKTFEDSLAISYSSVTNVRKVTRILLEAGKIAPADAQNVQNQADVARDGINIAAAIRTTDPAAAQTKLTAAVTILKALDAYLATRSPS